MAGEAICHIGWWEHRLVRFRVRVGRMEFFEHALEHSLEIICLVLVQKVDGIYTNFKEW